jgi:hypothetical protein
MGRARRPHVHGGKAQLVGVGVLAAGEHLPDHDAFQAARHGLDPFHVFHFQAGTGKQVGDFLGRLGQVHVLRSQL